MSKKCIICEDKIKDEFGKLSGTVVKSKDENSKNKFIYICSNCQKEKGWVERAKVKDV